MEPEKGTSPGKGYSFWKTIIFQVPAVKISRGVNHNLLNWDCDLHKNAQKKNQPKTNLQRWTVFNGGFLFLLH